MNKFQPGRLRGKAPEIAALYLAGKSTPEIARLYSVSNGAIKNCLVAHGVPRRNNSEAQKLRPKATQCRKGHLRTPDNVRIDGHCKQCAALAMSARYVANKSLCYEVHKQWISENRKHAKRYEQDYRLQKRFGITVAERDERRIAQNNKCMICGKEFVKTPHTDHDHETGQVRDLLCTDCNLGLGRFKDDPIIAQAAADYLKRWKKV